MQFVYSVVLNVYLLDALPGTTAVKASSDPTPSSSSRQHPHSNAQLLTSPAAAPVKVEAELATAVFQFCQGVLGTGVLDLGEIRDRLLLRQVSLGVVGTGVS